MLRNNLLYFSSHYTFKDFYFGNREIKIKAFEDRIKSFYIKPIDIMNKNELAFAAGVLCIVTIDFLARIQTNSRETSRNVFKTYLEENISEFKNKGDRFYEEFRCGLLHEGRIKNGGQFTYSLPEVLREENSIIIINPKLLIKKIEIVLKKYINELKLNIEKYKLFELLILKDFEIDF